MKYNTAVSASRRKQRKAHFLAPPNERRARMSSTLSRDLHRSCNTRALPILKDDEVRVLCGSFKGRQGKIIGVFRQKYYVHVDKLTREKLNGQTVHIPIHPSNLIITKLKKDRSRDRVIDLNKSKLENDKAEKITGLGVK